MPVEPYNSGPAIIITRKDLHRTKGGIKAGKAARTEQSGHELRNFYMVAGAGLAGKHYLESNFPSIPLG
jgi:hypothetical protein